MSNFFNIDYRKVIIGNLATFLRTRVRVQWLYVLITPLIGLYEVFKRFREDKLYQMSHNSQVVYLEKILNDNFDPVEREIVVQNTDLLEPIWHYDPVEQRPVYYYDEQQDAPVIFHDTEIFDQLNADFEVIIPQRLQPADPSEREKFETAVRVLIDYYKLYSKKYHLKYL